MGRATTVTSTVLVALGGGDVEAEQGRRLASGPGQAALAFAAVGDALPVAARAADGGAAVGLAVGELTGHDDSWTGPACDVAAALADRARHAQRSGEGHIVATAAVAALANLAPPERGAGLTWVPVGPVHTGDAGVVDCVEVSRPAGRPAPPVISDVVVPGDGWLVPAHHVGGAADLLEAAKAQQLEGIVTKRVDSPYLPGKRSPLWVKVKVRPRQEFVIGGWHPGERGLAGKIGSLLVGVYEGDKLRFAGKVGTGFTDRERDRVGALLAELAADEPAFHPPPPQVVSRSAHWVRPELVADVTFAEWTSSGTLRHPSYVALRDDKDPREVVRES